MKRLFLIYPVIVSAIVLLFTTACKKEEPATKPSLSTTPVTNITTVTATSGGIVANDGGASITANGVCWGATENPTTNDSKTADGVHTGQFVSNLAGLAAGTTYHVRAYATNSVGTAYGADMTFLTLGEAPACLTQAATNMTATNATLNGTVNPNDLSTTVTFEYGASTSYGSTATASQSPVTGNTIINVSVELTGLTPATTYHYRVKTVNSIGTTYGEDKTFNTLGQVPTATTGDATNKTTTGATLNGSVNANGSSTTITFEYGTTTNYGQTITATQSPVTGNTVTNVSADIAGLNPSTTYYFRVKTTNSIGITYGTQLSFTTTSLSQIKSEQILTNDKTDSGYGTSIAVWGNLAVISAGWENTVQANKAGAVYVYENNGSQWIEKQRITSPNGGYDYIFGHDVATNGTYIVITEPNAERAHIYSKVGSQWVLEKTFTVTNVSSEKYGISCDISENTVVIGSGAVFATMCSAIGSAYVYEKTGTEWINTAILSPSGGLAHDGFGVSVSIYNNTIAIGAHRADCYLGDAGYVCIFEKNGTSWSETQKLVAPDGTNGNRFGAKVDIEKGQLIVSSSGVGGVYYFEKVNSWEFKQKIISPNLSGNDGFGVPVSLSNNYLLIGAFTDDERFTNQGAIYLFEFDGTNWNNKLKIIPSEAKANDAFGYPLFLKNNYAFGASPVSTAGKVYAFTLQ
jgi:hypothetical protein